MDDGSILESIFKNLEQIQTDQLLFVTESQQTKTNIGTTYVDIFPASINGNPIPIDTTGFTKIGIQLFWNKNAGTSNHDFRIVNDADDTKVLYEKLNISSVITEDFTVSLNGNFTNFVGKLRIQAKAGNATDDPIFLGLRLYLRR